MLQLLLAAACCTCCSASRGEALDPAGVRVPSRSSITIVQEQRTERALEALRDLTSPRALVMRDGAAQRIAGREVVRGDLLVLAEGDRVAGRRALLDVQDDLQADESLLTGESVPVRKIAAKREAQPESRPGRRRSAFVYSGTLVVRGTGTGERHRHRRRAARSAASARRWAPSKPSRRRCRREIRRLVRLFVGDRPGYQRAGGAALRPAARRLAGRAARRHHAGDGDAAGGIPGGADGVHGDGRLAHLAGSGC